MVIAFFSAVTVICALILIMFRQRYVYNKASESYKGYFKKLIDELSKELNEEKDKVAIANASEAKALARVKEVEDGVKHGFGIDIRNEVTKIECFFNKPEMAFIMAGIHKIIESPGSTIEDKEYLIRLYKKIQSNIEQMDEPEISSPEEKW